MILKGPLEHPSVSEADIQAYTDGSIAGERATRVRRYLAMQPGEWRRILFYRRLNAQMRRVFQRVQADSQADLQADPEPATAVRHRGWRRVCRALLSAVMLTGAAVAWLATSEPTPQMLNAAAVMALMDANSIAAGEAPANTAGMASAPFDLQTIGLRLVARGAPDLGPLALARRYVYENAQGQKIVLLGARAWFAKDEPQWSARRIGVLRLISWTAHRTRWVLAGNAHTRDLMRAADLATMAGAGSARREANSEELAGEDGTWESVTN
jgi:hypothetical protein